MFKLFGRKTITGVNDEIDFGLDVAPVSDLANIKKELTYSECFELILQRLDTIEVKINKLQNK